MGNPVFRGRSMHQGVSVQPTLSYGILDSLKASFWSNFRLENSIALSETNYSLQWSWLNPSPAALTVGGIYYDRSSKTRLPKTAEVFAGVDFSVPGNPGVYAFYDCDRQVGTYWQVQASHRFVLPSHRGTVDLSAALGFDTGRVNNFQDARLSLGFTRHLGEWRLRPQVDFNFPSGSIDPGVHAFRPVFRVNIGRTF